MTLVRFRPAVWLTAVLLLQACGTQGAPADLSTPFPGEDGSPAPTSTAPGEASPSRFLSSVRNAGYQLGLSDQIRVVQLTDGRYQQGERDDIDFLAVFVTDYLAQGDLNGDGIDEAVALITENYGGTGSFVFLVVYRNNNGTPQFLTSTFLDDRPLIGGLSIEGGEVIVEATIHDFDDPMCCPTLVTTRHYGLFESNLVLREYATLAPTGDARMITIESPAEGAQASGIVNVRGRISIAPFENTLVYRLVDMGGLELSAGPVSVQAADLGAPGTFNQAIDLGRILTNTTIRIEVQDISAADGSLIAMDSILLQVK